VRLLVCGTLLLVLSLPLLAQSSETGGDSEDNPSTANARRAQPVGAIDDPGASQDAEAAREKLLKASDQIDLMETNAEATKQAVDGMKAGLVKIEDENTALKQQVSTLQDTVTRQQDEIDKMEANRAKERQALIDEVSSLVAGKTATHHHIADTDETPPAPKKHVTDDSASDSTTATDASTPLAPPPDPSTSGPVKMPPSASADDSTASTPDAASTTPPATPHPRKGYYHVVAPHETLSLICQAYRDHGVNVTVTQIRHANGLTSKSTLKAGQKLFIPKPGT
jgi:regulator of replication initiation timing